METGYSSSFFGFVVAVVAIAVVDFVIPVVGGTDQSMESPTLCLIANGFSTTILQNSQSKVQ